MKQIAKLFRRGLALSAALCLLLCVGASARQTKLIALTFDDGPEETDTPLVLDELERQRVRATFFVVGDWTVGKSAILRRELEDGDQLGNHTQTHAKLTRLSDSGVAREVDTMSAYLETLTGECAPFMMRPPYGARTRHIISEIKAPVILWSVDAAAGKQVRAGALVSRTLSKAADGGIILMHDTTRNNVDAVRGIVEGLHERGFELVTVRELFRLKGVVPKNGTLYSRVTNPNPQAYDETRLAEHWAYESIRDVEALGVMTGGADGFFPNRYLTRGQAVTVLWRLCGSPVPETQSDFFDVSAVDSCAPAAAWAEETGIVRGSDGRFAPNAYVTRQQLYVMLARLAVIQDVQYPRTDTPVSYDDDVRIDPWAQEGVEMLRGMGFASRNDVELFRPHDWATRGEMAELVDFYAGLTA
jgi:peptidoglycan/xylan/chitin deacetylase (PgdA/CDA1 family)